MYVISLTYKVELSQMDEARPLHLEWLKKHYDSGLFIASGRQNPPVGGVIIANQIPRAELDALLKTDPFAQQNLAEYDIVEFEAKMTCNALKGIA